MYIYDYIFVMSSCRRILELCKGDIVERHPLFKTSLFILFSETAASNNSQVLKNQLLQKLFRNSLFILFTETAASPYTEVINKSAVFFSCPFPRCSFCSLKQQPFIYIRWLKSAVFSCSCFRRLFCSVKQQQPFTIFSCFSAGQTLAFHSVQWNNSLS